MTLNRRRCSEFVTPPPGGVLGEIKKINKYFAYSPQPRPIFYDRKNGFLHIGAA